jgi:hypothetical protein
MNTAIKIGIFSILSLGFVAAACSDDEDGPSTTRTSSTTTTTVGPGGGDTGGGGGGIPLAPSLGPQIDRKGRPAINTALNKAFIQFGSTMMGEAIPDATRDMAEDAWNAADDPTMWATTFAADVSVQLGVLDALNATTTSGCGDQAAYSVGMNYTTLATVLSNDWLVVKGDAAGGCSVYLGVEANFLGITNDTCGGRTPEYDVIDVSYSLLSGAFTPAPTFDFGDNVDAKPETLAAFNAGFPYLADPNSQ